MKIFDYKIASSIFRILISLHIIKKYIFLFFQREIIFSNQSFLHHSNDSFLNFLGISSHYLRENNTFILLSTIIVSILFLFGIGRRITCVLLYILVEILQRLNGYILNGGDNLLKFLLLYLCLINCYEYFVFTTRKYTNNNNFDNLISNIGIVCIKIHLCLIYFISAIFKLNATVWFKGIATYYVLNLDRFKGSSLNEVISKNYIFVTISTYTTLLWELSFPYLIWVKQLKIPILLLGIIIHLGIYYFMMIHDFEILFLFTYILFFNDSEINDIFRKILDKFNYAKNRFFT